MIGRGVAGAAAPRGSHGSRPSRATPAEVAEILNASGCRRRLRRSARDRRGIRPGRRSRPARGRSAGCGCGARSAAGNARAANAAPRRHASRRRCSASSPPAAPLAGAGPSGIAAPEMAAETRAPLRRRRSWMWERPPPRVRRVTLADLGLEPVDVLTLDDRSSTRSPRTRRAISLAGGAERVAAARRLARAITGALERPPVCRRCRGRATISLLRATSDRDLLAAFAGGDPGDDLLVIAARWGTPIATTTSRIRLERCRSACRTRRQAHTTSWRRS